MRLRPTIQKKHTLVGTVIVSVLIVASCIFFGNMLFPRPVTFDRRTLVIASDPVVVVSYSEKEQSFLLLTLPTSLVTEGTHGYGAYSLEAFWRLGQIDKKDGSVLSESMTEALGIPVTEYIGNKNGLMDGSDPLAIAKDVFSLPHVFTLFTGGYLTNISPWQFYQIAWMLHGQLPQRLKTIDFARKPFLIAETLELPDGSHQDMLNRARLDNALKGIFEDTGVRREGVTVAVYNTTQVGSLGDRVARLLTNIGVSVVTVGNDTPVVSSCQVRGLEEAIKSMTSKVIQQALRCTPLTVKTAGRADLVVLIGLDYAARFEPNK